MTTGMRCTSAKRWMATENTFATLGQARFQGADAAATLLMYEEAAFLVEQLASNPGAAADISFAIWSIFSPGVPSTGNSAWWLNYAQNQTYTSGEFANFIILTPTDSSSGSAQEYLVNTPEPASILLLGSGLFALGFGAAAPIRSVKSRKIPPNLPARRAAMPAGLFLSARNFSSLATVHRDKFESRL